jgi:hypothetical protein
MNIRSIKSALRRLDDEGGAKAAKKLVLVVPFKRGKAPSTKADVIAAVAHNRGEPVAKVKEYMAKGAIGVAMAASGIEYRMTEGDLLFILGGKYGGFELAGDVVYFSPSDLAMDKAMAADGNLELFDDLNAVTSAILYGGSRRGGPWFDTGR